MHRLSYVSITASNDLCVRFTEGYSKLFLMAETYARWPAFAALRDNGKLHAFTISEDGLWLQWEEFGLSISCDELWAKGRPIPSPFNGMVSLADVARLHGVSERDLRRGIQTGIYVIGIDVCRIGNQWVFFAFDPNTLKKLH